MKFDFATATRIVFGRGKLADVPLIARSFGERALLVTGRSPARSQPLVQGLTDQRIKVTGFATEGEPTIDTVRRGVELARHEKVDLVISIGGGSVIDAGKAIAAMLTNPGDPLDYLEVVGKGIPIAKLSAPFIAIPTTAGTGAEVTRNAVLASPEHKTKVSMRSPLMLPTVAVVDSALTQGLPPAMTAATGLDALTQLIEPYLSCNRNPLTDAVCREGIQRAARSLPRAFSEDDPAARDEMAMASLFGGLALANAGLGAVHGFAGPLGGMYDAPHGALCAALLPYVFDVNARAIDKAGDQDLQARVGEVRRIVGDLESLVRNLKIPALRAYGIAKDEFPRIIEKAAGASSMRGNPVKLTSDQLREVLERAW